MSTWSIKSNKNLGEVIVKVWMWVCKTNCVVYYYHCPAVYPNPASDELTISFVSDNATGMDSVFVSPYEVRIHDNSQNLVYVATSDEATLKIPTGNYPEGDYIVNISNKEGIIQRHIHISR